MIFTVGLKRICDISFYFTFASFVAVSFGGDNFIIALPIFAIVAFLSAYLAPHKKLKFLSLLLFAVVPFIVPPTLANLAAIVPAMVYTVLTLPVQDEKVSQFQYADHFGLFLKLLLALIFIAFLLDAIALLENGPLLFALSFLINAVILMRMVRHDEAILQQTQFKIMNAVSLFSVMLIVVLLSTDAFLTLVRNFIAFIWTNVAIPVIELLIFIFVTVINFLFNLFRVNVLFERLGVMIYEIEIDALEPLEPLLDEPSGVIPNPLPFIGAIILMVIFYRLLKSLSEKWVARSSSDGVEEERIPLDDRKNKERKRFTPENPIRSTYRKFLRKLEKNGTHFPHYFTSNDVNDLVSKTINTNKGSNLRELYIRIRYGEADFTKEELRNFKRLCREISQSLSTQSGSHAVETTKKS